MTRAGGGIIIFCEVIFMKRKIFSLAIILILAAALTASAAQRRLAKTESNITSGVALSGSTIFFGSYSGTLSAVNTNNYSLLWTFDNSDSAVTGIPAVQDGKVIFAQSTGEVICLNASDGSLVWQFTPRKSDSENEGLNDGVAVGGGKVYAAFDSGILRAFDINSGKVAWQYKAEQGLRTAPVYANGIIMLGEYDGIFSMIDAKSGKRLNGGGAGGALNSPAVSKGNVYYTAWDGSVHGVQIKDVIPLWSVKPCKEPITTPPVIAESLLVFGTAHGNVIALDTKDGSIIWQYDTQGGQIPSKPVISQGRVLAGTESGKIVVLNASSGRLVEEYNAQYVLNGENALYFVSENNELCCMQ